MREINPPTSNEMSISEEGLDKRRRLTSLSPYRLNMNTNVDVSIDRVGLLFQFFKKRKTSLVSLIVFFSSFCAHRLLQTRVSCPSWKQPFSLLPWRGHAHHQKAPSPYLTRTRRQQSRCLTSYFNTSFPDDQWARRRKRRACWWCTVERNHRTTILTYSFDHLNGH